MGFPSIVAGRGPERGGWSRSVKSYIIILGASELKRPCASNGSHDTPYPLWLSDPDSKPAPVSSEPGPSSASSSSSPPAKMPTVENFTMGLCMLNYNVAYLAHTQGLDIPLSLTGETLRNLWAVCHMSADAYAR